MKRLRSFIGIAAMAASMCGAARAEDHTGTLSLELNAADTVGESCRLTFVLTNALDSGLDRLVTETVLFSDSGQVVLLTLFDFGELPAGRPRVRQFQVPETSCARLGQVLVNGAETCTVNGEASRLCESALDLSSRVRIELKG